MSRTFSFRSAADVAATASDLGVDGPLRAERDVSVLTAPLAFGTLRAPNRLGVHPMEGCDAGADGSPGPLTRRRWARFAAGGAGTLWGEAAAVSIEGRANPRQLVVSDTTAPALAKLVSETRAAAGPAGIVLGLQLTHSGRFSHPTPLPPTANAVLDAVRGGGVPRLDVAALDALVDRYVAAASIASAAGFDFVDVKHCHGYLLSELLGRPGPVEARAGLGVEIVRRIRAEVPAVEVACRLNVWDGWRGGIGSGDDDATAGVDAARLLVEAGVTLVSVTLGSPYVNPHIGRPYEKAPVDAGAAPEHPLVGVARHAEWTATVAAAVSVPVVGAGWSWLRHLAPPFAASVADGCLFLGRGALAYPDFARDLLETGSMQPGRTCLTTSQCTALMRAKHCSDGQFPVGCVPRDGAVYRDVYRRMIETRPR